MTPAELATLPAHDHRARRDRLRPQLADLGADRVLISDPRNVRYLSGFTGSAGVLLVGADAREDLLFTDARYEQRAAREAPDIGCIIVGDGPWGALERCARGSVLAVEAAHLSWAAARRLTDEAEAHEVSVTPTTRLVEGLRVVKDAAELARIESACAITVQALEWLVAEVVAPGRSERELATALERRFVDLGAEGAGFASIVAGGSNSAIPHHAPGERPLARGDLLTIDCGALVDGYHADHTRTYAIGAVSDELAEVHDLVGRAQAAGRAAAVAGARASSIDDAARELITSAGHGERFVHGTGHGVGLAIHEPPAVSGGSADTLRACTPLTVEPGVYLPGLGGVRIEDTIVVTADGPARCLTDTPRSLRVL